MPEVHDASLEAPSNKRPSMMHAQSSTRGRSSSIQASFMRSASIVDEAGKDAAKSRRQAKLAGYFGLTMALFLAISALANFAIIYRVVDEQVQTTTDNDGVMHAKNNASAVVQTATVETMATLAALPCQSVAFMNELREVTLVVDDVVRKYSIDNYAWFNASYMELYVQYGQHTIIIDNHIAYVNYGNGRVGRVSVDGGARGRQRRALAAAKPARHLKDILGESATHGHASDPRVYSSFEQMLDVYHEAVLGHARALNEASSADTLMEVYRFFGGVVSSTTPAHEYVATGSCATGLFTVQRAPTPDVPIISKWEIVWFEQVPMTMVMDLTDMDAPRFHTVYDRYGQMDHEVIIAPHLWEYHTSNSSAHDPGMKAGCAVRNDMAADPLLDIRPGDNIPPGTNVINIDAEGTAVWRVGAHNVTVSADGTVTRFDQYRVTSIIEANLATTRLGWVVPFSNCSTDPNDDPWVDLETRTTYPSNVINASGHVERRLFSYPGTDWCGPTSCGGTYTVSSALEGCCYQHDHGKPSNWGSTLPCGVDKGIVDCRGSKSGPTGLYTTIGTVFGSYFAAWPCKKYVWQCHSCGKGCSRCGYEWQSDGWNKYEGANLGGSWSLGAYKSSGTCQFDCSVSDSGC